MSEPSAPEGRPAPRYQRSSGGLLGALIVTVVAVVAFVAFRGLTGSEDPATPVRTVDYAVQVEAGRADDKLAVWSPPSLPAGWRATSATYTTGVDASWHLGVLTDEGRYVGVEESRDGVEDLVETHVDEDAEQGEDVTIAGETWQTWSDPGGDYAVSREIGDDDSLLVVGSAPPADVRRLAGELSDR